MPTGRTASAAEALATQPDFNQGISKGQAVALGQAYWSRLDGLNTPLGEPSVRGESRTGMKGACTPMHFKNTGALPQQFRHPHCPRGSRACCLVIALLVLACAAIPIFPPEVPSELDRTVTFENRAGHPVVIGGVRAQLPPATRAHPYAGSQ